MRLVMLGVQILLIGVCTGAAEPTVCGTVGVILRGSVVGSILDARFEVSNGSLTCAGPYPSYKGRIVTIPLRCDDGLGGVALVTRRDALNGSGTVQFSDGSEGIFVFSRRTARSPSVSSLEPQKGIASTPVAR